ncbi:cytochrome P450 2C15-like [Panonychus citri]|uniref:cytochrome P450 2C15-like n=1 Tax=Panonychus citri TaxID=50023 RepID=UPI0023083147|nr:cytochrome P450 2C15-like [Panonychus citri]
MFYFNDDPSSYPKSVLVIFTLIVVYLARYLINWFIKIRSLPPGPWGLPVLGYLPFIRNHIYLEFDFLAKQYGPVFCLKLGIHHVIVISDWDHMKEAFSNEDLLARPHETFFPGIMNERSLIEMSGDSWRDHRQTAMSILRNVGLGKSSMEEKISDEIDQFLTTLDSDSVDFEAKILPSVSNNISILLFGHKFDYKDPVKLQLDRDFNDVVKHFQFAGVTAFLPWLSNVLIAFGKFNADVVAKAIRSSHNYFQTEIDKHEQKFDENEVIDYLDGYLLERKNRHRKGQNADDVFSIQVLLRNTADFFGAGSETVISTLTWAMVYLVKYPELQDKIREEIMNNIGSERKPMFTDRNQMPFTMAFLNETHRHASVLPVNLLRRAAKDTKIGQFNIPKDCIVIFNFWSVHYDPKLWDNPEEFNPDRFLTKSNGESKVTTPKYLVPFSGGKRACPGEGLAQVELFLYLTNILQKFQISTESGTKVSLDSHYGIARRPKTMPKLIFTRI